MDSVSASCESLRRGMSVIDRKVKKLKPSRADSDVADESGRSAPSRQVLARVRRWSNRSRNSLLGALLLFVLAAWTSAPVTLAQRPHLFSGSFGSHGSGPGMFTAPAGMAVNESTGDVYVVDKGDDRVELFSSSGSFEGQFDGTATYEHDGEQKATEAAPSGQLSAPEGIAVDNTCALHGLDPQSVECEELDPSNGDVYVADVGHAVVDKFSSLGAYLGQITEGPSGTPLSELDGVTVGREGNPWVYEGNGELYRFSEAAINEFESERVSEASGFAQPGLAVDAEGNLYVVHTLDRIAAKLSESGAVLDNEIDDEEVSGVATEPPSGDVYLDNESSVRRFDSTGQEIEQFGAGILGQGSGVALDAGTETVYVADAQRDQVDVFARAEPAAPTIEGEAAATVSVDAAELEAEVDPQGANTTYTFQYAQCGAFGPCASSSYISVANGELPADWNLHRVSTQIEDLAPHTSYRYRVLFDNAHGLSTGEERVFTTEALGGALTLLDDRIWEQVSPQDKHGGLVEPPQQSSGSAREAGIAQAAASGDAITYSSSLPSEESTEGFTSAEQVVSSRTSTGWTSEDIATAHYRPSGKFLGRGQEYRIFSEDLSESIVEPFGPFTPLSAHVSERTPYLRSQERCSQEPATECFEPLVSDVEPYADIAPGTDIGEPSASEANFRFEYATPDLRHAIVDAPISGPARGTYEWFAGKPPSEELELVTQLPAGEGGEAVPSSLGDGEGNGIPDGEPNVRHALSNNGARVFFSANGHLYARNTFTRAPAVRLDAAQGVAEPSGEHAVFQIASAEGERVFFTAGRLTASSAESGDLYVCGLAEVASKLTCELTDLTPEREGEAADVSRVVGTSEDGSYVYFVANGVLAAGARPGSCAGEAEERGATCNLYMLHWNGSSWEPPALVAVLARADLPDWRRDLERSTSRVSPNGQYIAFMSELALTGYNNRDIASGKPDEELYLYDAVTKRLACVSCDPTGARPTGVEYGETEFLVGGNRVWSPHQWLAADVPGWDGVSQGLAIYQPRYLSNNGRVYFDSDGPLVPEDENGTWDVYEFEPSGVEGGGVGFFITAASLVAQDNDTAFDVYAARECSVGERCTSELAAPSPECSTLEACRTQPSPGPSIFAAPPSETFTGPGNPAPPAKPAAKPLTRAQKLKRALDACRRKHIRQTKRAKRARSACERKARHAYGGKRRSKRVKKKGHARTQEAGKR